MIKKNKNKKILFCTAISTPENAGGGKNAFNFAKYLNSKNYEVTLLSLNVNLNYQARTYHEGLNITRIPYFNYNFLSKALSSIILLSYYTIYCFRYKTIFIYGGYMPFFKYIIILGKVIKRKVIFRSTLLDEDDLKTLIEKNKLLKTTKKYIFKKLFYYFSINPEFNKIAQAIYGEEYKIFNFTQGYNSKIFFPFTKNNKVELRKKFNFSDKKLIIITIGHLINRKGYSEIFDALTKIEIPFEYIIIGAYSVNKEHFLYKEKDEMNSLFLEGKKKLGEKIKFIGEVKNPQEYLNASDIFLLNSSTEGFPNSLIEAMACGLCPIVKKIKGSEYNFLKHEKNIIFYTYFSEIIMNIEKCYENKNFITSIGDIAAQTIKNYSFENLYNHLLNDNII